MTQALYRKWRPSGWQQVVGQEHIVLTLKNAIQSDRLAHALLFAGPRGTGKTSVARILAKAVNCLGEKLESIPCDQCDHCISIQTGRFLDLIEIDAASNTSVDHVRDLRDKINFAPNQGKYKVYIVDEVHMLSTAAFNALLKTLEEPPPHAIFVLATTEIHKIPVTVLSRCQKHDFRRIPVELIQGKLKEIAAEERIKVNPEAITLIARQATGSLRDGISLLDQLACVGEELTLEMVRQTLGISTSQSVVDVVDAILNKQTGKGLDHIHQCLDSGTDPRHYARQIVEFFRNMLMIKMGNEDIVDEVDEIKEKMIRHAEQFSKRSLLLAINAFNNAATNRSGSGWLPALPLEMALLELIVEPEDDSNSLNQTPVRKNTPSLNVAEDIGSEVQYTATIPATDMGRGGKATAENNQDAFNRILKGWKTILSEIKRTHPIAQGLLNSGRVLSVEGSTLILGFSSEIIKSKMEKGDNILFTSNAIRKVIGLDLSISCVITSTRGFPAYRDYSSVESDGMVATALRDLGGEIVDIQ